MVVDEPARRPACGPGSMGAWVAGGCGDASPVEVRVRGGYRQCGKAALEWLCGGTRRGANGGCRLPHCLVFRQADGYRELRWVSLCLLREGGGTIEDPCYRGKLPNEGLSSIIFCTLEKNDS